MIANTEIVYSSKGYYFRIVIGKVPIRSQYSYKKVSACRNALKQLCELLNLTYEEE